MTLPIMADLIGDLGRKLARLLDQLLDRLFGGQDTNQLTPGVDFIDVLRQPRRIAVREFADSGDAGDGYKSRVVGYRAAALSAPETT